MVFPPQFSFFVCVFSEPIDVLKMLSRFPPSNDYSSSSYCGGGDRRENNKLTCTQNKENYSFEKGNVLACTKSIGIIKKIQGYSSR